MRGGGWRVRPAPGRPGDRLRHRGPARLPVPARPQPGLLRLQARQRHPGRRRGQADRPRRGAPPRRPRLRDLRHDGLPGAGGARTSGPSVASDIYTIGRTLTVLAMEFRGYQSTYVASLPAGRPDAAVPEARLALPAAAQGVRSRPGRPVRLRRRAARAAARRAPRGRGPRARGRGRALDVVPALRRARRSPTTPSTGRTCPTLRVDDSDPQAPWLRTREHRRPRAAAGRPGERAGEAAPRCCSPRRAPRSRPASYDRVDDAVQALLADDPWEWRAVWMSGLVALARGRTAEAQSAFNAVYGQVPGELAPKLALAFACETGGEADVAESLYVVCARTDANYIAPAAFGLARIRSGRGDVDGRGPRPRPGAGDQPRLHPGAAPPGRPARRVGWRAAVPGGRAGRASTASPSTPSTGPASGSTCCSSALEHRASRTAPTPTVSIAGRPAAEPALRDGLEAAYRDLAALRRQPRGAGRASSTRPTRCADGRCDDGAGRTGPWHVERSSRPGDGGAVLPVLLRAPVARGRAVLRGLRRRARRRAAPAGRGRGASGRGTAAEASAAAGQPTPPRGLPRVRRRRSPPTATARSAGPRRRARATTSPSSRRPGWPPSATAASATPQRGRGRRCTPGPSRAATPSSSSATGCRPRPTPTSPAWPRRGPPATCSPPPTPSGHRHGRRPRRGDRRGTRRGRRRGQRRRHRPHRRGPGNPASCTFVAAVVDGVAARGRAGSATAAPTGCPTRATPQLLTVDDSFAAEQIAARACPAPRPRAGRRPTPSPAGSGIDAPDHTPRTASLDLDGPGWVLVCSDGLWNYCSGAARPGRPGRRARPRRRAPSRSPLAEALVDWANAQGGQDNITVALARVDARPDHAPHQPTAASTRSPRHTERKSRQMATFSADVYQNEFLPDGGHRRPRDRHRHLLRRRRGRAVRVGGRGRDRHRRHLRLDGRATRSRPPSRPPRRRWTRSSTASGSPSSPAATRRGWPIPLRRASSAWCGWTPAPAPRPRPRWPRFCADGGTAMGTWLTLATRRLRLGARRSPRSTRSC